VTQQVSALLVEGAQLPNQAGRDCPACHSMLTSLGPSTVLGCAGLNLSPQACLVHVARRAPVVPVPAFACGADELARSSVNSIGTSCTGCHKNETHSSTATHKTHGIWAHAHNPNTTLLAIHKQ